MTTFTYFAQGNIQKDIICGSQPCNLITNQNTHLISHKIFISYKLPN